MKHLPVLAILAIILFSSFVASSFGFDNPNLPRIDSPTLSNGSGGGSVNLTGIPPINVNNGNISITIDQSLTEGDTNSVASPAAILEWPSQPGKYQEFHDDFMFYSNNRAYGDSNWLQTCTSTGANIVNPNSEDNHNGIIRPSTGTTTTGFCTTYKATDSIYISGGEVFEVVVRPNSLTNPGVDDHVIRVGLGDANSGDFTDGIYFEFYLTGGNSGAWDGKTASSGSRSQTSVQYPLISPTWVVLTAKVNAAANSVEFCFDYSFCQSLTTNIPTGKTMELRFQIEKQGVGTNSANYDIDSVGFRRIQDAP